MSSKSWNLYLEPNHLTPVPLLLIPLLYRLSNSCLIFVSFCVYFGWLLVYRFQHFVILFQTKADKNFRIEHYEQQIQAFRSVIEERRSHFNADFTLKFTPTEAKKSKQEPEESSNGTDTSENRIFRFAYSKNETYQLFLSYSSKKVRPNT